MLERCQGTKNDYFLHQLSSILTCISPLYIHYSDIYAPINNNLQLNIYDQKSQQSRRNKEIICINRRIIYREKTHAHCICSLCCFQKKKIRFIFLFFSFLILLVSFQRYAERDLTHMDRTKRQYFKQQCQDARREIWKTEVSGRFDFEFYRRNKYVPAIAKFNKGWCVVGF